MTAWTPKRLRLGPTARSRTVFEAAPVIVKLAVIGSCGVTLARDEKVMRRLTAEAVPLAALVAAPLAALEPNARASLAKLTELVEAAPRDTDDDAKIAGTVGPVNPVAESNSCSSCTRPDEPNCEVSAAPRTCR